MTRSILASTLTLAIIAILQGCASSPSISDQTAFPTPQAATDALVAALSPHNDNELSHIFGTDFRDFLSSGDDTADLNSISTFLSLYTQRHEFTPDTEDTRTLLIGQDRWPFPIPIVGQPGEWRFDTVAGREEIHNRRIGMNEIDAITTCLAYVDAQLDFAMRDTNNDGIREYARQVLSTPGTQNGLFWQTAEYEPPSPLGPLVADASEEGYEFDPNATPRPFHGYVYTILLAQGPDAPDGPREYVINGKMIGGFALIARPATYDNSGIMTFIVNQDGIVYEQDLGKNTERRAKAITTFNPDNSWTPVNEKPFVGPDWQVATPQ